MEFPVETAIDPNTEFSVLDNNPIPFFNPNLDDTCAHNKSAFLNTSQF